jgi:hypothetical protein
LFIVTLPRSDQLAVRVTPVRDDDVEQTYFQQYLCDLGDQSAWRENNGRLNV